MKVNQNYINPDANDLLVYFVKRIDEKYVFGFTWGYDGQKLRGFRILRNRFEIFIEVVA